MSVEDKYVNSIAIVYPAVLHMDERVAMPIDFETNFHCTIQYLGEIGEVDFTRQDLVDALTVTSFPDELVVPVRGKSLFGRDRDMLVLRLESDQIHANFDSVTAYLLDNKLTNPHRKLFSRFTPHVTVREGFHGSHKRLKAPRAVTLTKPVVWWGTESP